MRRRAVGDDVSDVLNTENVFLLPGYYGFVFRWKGAFRELGISHYNDGRFKYPLCMCVFVTFQSAFQLQLL